VNCYLIIIKNTSNYSVQLILMRLQLVAVKVLNSYEYK